MLTLQKTMEKRHNDVAGLDCASALRPLTLGTGADLAQSAYTRVMQEVRVRKNTEAVNSGGVKEKKMGFFVSEKYRTALRSQSQSLWVKIRDLHQIRVLLQFTGSISVVLRPGFFFFF